ncbi:MAG: AAA family ATPase [Clostridia bacterium]|nr:AAA family ATPase [Clostridia bacterium]
MKKKHIILAGTSRAGKTTLSMELAKLQYTHYKMDPIKRALFGNMAEGNSEDWDEISPKMAKIINQILEDNKSDTDYNQEHYVIDTCHLYPEDAKKIENEDTKVIFLGYADSTVDAKLEDIRKNDKDNYWTTKLQDDELKELLRQNIEYSNKIKQDCQKYGITYYDTGASREETLKKIFDDIQSGKI